MQVKISAVNADLALFSVCVIIYNLVLVMYHSSLSDAYILHGIVHAYIGWIYKVEMCICQTFTDL